MKRVLVTLAVLLLLSPVVQAQNPFQGQQTDTKGKVVVVDPMDFRKPIPEPGKGLSDKYSGQTVRFTGVVGTVTQDKNNKNSYWYEFQTEVTEPQGNGKVKKETIVVRVNFQNDEKALRTQKPKNPVTVEGLGEIESHDGSLVIRNAKLVANDPAPRR